MNSEDSAQVAAVGLVSRLVERASRQGLALCHWKSNIRLPLSVVGKTDLDLSIPPEQEAELCVILNVLGFVPFRSPIWSRYPGVSDWLGLDIGTGSLLHVHLHTRLLTGTSSVKEQDLPWLEMLNSELITDKATGIFIPPRGFEFHQLLARESVKSLGIRGLLMRLSRRSVPGVDEVEELRWLQAESAPEEIEYWGEKLWGTRRWQRMRFLIPEMGKEIDAFRHIAAEINRALVPWRRGSVISNGLRFVALRLAGSLVARWSLAMRGHPPRKRVIGQRAPIVAFVGCDGAGKSTVVADTQKWLSWKADAVTLYLGSKKGLCLRVYRALVQLRRGHKSGGKHSKNEKEFIQPTFLRALRGVINARVRLKQQRHAKSMAHAGVIVLTDRWPQGEIQGMCDGPSVSSAHKSGWLFNALRRYELKLIKQQSGIRPDLIIKLIVPIDIALQRKPDHSAEMLFGKIDTIRKLSFDGVRVIEVDSTQSLQEVVRSVRGHVWTILRKMAN
jgi:thymidylate kinase